MSLKDKYIVDVSTGEVIWVSLGERGMLRDYGYIYFKSEQSTWFFKNGKRSPILDILKYERTLVK